MINNREIKLINSLKRKKNRIEEGLFVVEGEKNVEELLQSSFNILDIYATDDWANEADCIKISQKDLGRISSLSTPNKVLALAKIPVSGSINTNITSIVIDGVNDPGNLGTIIRTANWFGSGYQYFDISGPRQSLIEPCRVSTGTSTPLSG